MHFPEDHPHVRGNVVRGIAGVDEDGHEGSLRGGSEPHEANILPEELGTARTAGGHRVALGSLGILLTHGQVGAL